MPSEHITKIRQKSLELGFDLIGFTNQFEPLHKNYFINWVSEEKYGEMLWLGKNVDKRADPQLIFPQTKSAIVLGVSYYHDVQLSKDYKIARYAHGQDYHVWIKKMCEDLATFIQSSIDKNFEWRSFVDTGPVLERDLAVQAGLGWIGKNTCLIHPEQGSFLFLAVIFCNLDFENSRTLSDLCKDCQLCLEACPTEAIDDYKMDAAKCLAYHNIEKRGERDSSFYHKLDHLLVGCDICQGVCPHNYNVKNNRQNEWQIHFKEFALGDLKDILEMTETEYKTKTKNSALSRIKYFDFMRNVFIVAANTKRTDLADDIKLWQKRHPLVKCAELQYCIDQLKL